MMHIKCCFEILELLLLLSSSCQCLFLGSLSRRTTFSSQFRSRNAKANSLSHFTVPKYFSAKPPCPISDRCGGCQLQRISYNSQLVHKKYSVTDAFSVYPHIRANIEDIAAAASSLKYRNRAQFAIQKDSTEKVVVGLFESKTNQVVDTDYCAIQHPLTNAVLAQFRKLIRSQQLSAYDETTSLGSLRHIVIRVGFESQELMVCLVTATHKVPHLQSFVNYMRQIPQMKSILLHYNPLPGDQVIRDENETTGGVCYTKVLSGKDHIMDTVAGVKVKVSLQSFMQSNPSQTDKLYSTVRDFILQSSISHYSAIITEAAENSNRTKQRKVWDLYCGVGTIGMYLTTLSCVSSVIGVESCEAAVRDAQANAALNNITNIRFIHAAAEDIISPQRRLSSRNISAITDAADIITSMNHANNGSEGADFLSMCANDVVILNPPRRGCHKSLLVAIRNSAARTVIYVSCNPTTLARDLDILIRGTGLGKDYKAESANNNKEVIEGPSGYLSDSCTVPEAFTVRKVQPIDMFPHTVHVETVVWLERVN